jgi:hypothetical protein
VRRTGEKLTPLINGKSQRPRSFKTKYIENLELSYKFNKKAWMTLLIFQEWFIGLNDQFIDEGRKTLLFLIMHQCTL